MSNQKTNISEFERIHQNIIAKVIDARDIEYDIELFQPGTFNHIQNVVSGNTTIAANETPHSASPGEQLEILPKSWKFITLLDRDNLSFITDQKIAYEKHKMTVNNEDYVKICNTYKKLLDKKMADNKNKASQDAHLAQLDNNDLPDFPHLKVNGKGQISIPTHPENTEHLFINMLGISIRWNDLTKDMCIEHGLTYLNNGFSSDNNEVITYLEGLATENDLSITRTNLINHIAKIGKQYRYHPVKEFLEQVKWDGNDYFEQVFNTLTLHKSANVEISRLLFRKWLIMCVAAALAPNGIAPQGVLVLQGPQGIGKTTWLKNLMPNPEWFCEGMQLDPRNKDDVIQFVRNWVVELGEIDATFRKADISALKAFVTRNVDEYRPPYGASIERFPRRTCFGGTVNDVEFLSDDENRRFWVLPITSIERDHNIDLSQFWAQIVEIYRSGEPFWLNSEEMAELQVTNNNFRKLSPLEQRLEDYGLCPYDKNDRNSLKHLMSLTEIFEHIGMKSPNSRDISVLKKYLEQKKVFRQTRGAKKWEVSFNTSHTVE